MHILYHKQHLNQLVEMSRQIDFNYEKSNDEIKKILKKNKITDFFLDDITLDLYQCHSTTNAATSGEYWYVIFNDKKP